VPQPLRVAVKEKKQAVKQQTFLVVLCLSSGNLRHFTRRGPTSFERGFVEEFEESFIVYRLSSIVKIKF
jgi:hypothetical protein